MKTLKFVVNLALVGALVWFLVSHQQKIRAGAAGRDSIAYWRREIFCCIDRIPTRRRAFWRGTQSGISGSQAAGVAHSAVVGVDGPTLDIASEIRMGSPGLSKLRAPGDRMRICAGQIQG